MNHRPRSLKPLQLCATSLSGQSGEILPETGTDNFIFEIEG